ncbi:Transcription regulatory protein SNF2 [Spathaspora sp. JA1]|nr:Transcription regulatory protein SNF2 [Spathaspora sp. JA1]
MNQQMNKEEIHKIANRWQQLREQFGDQAVNVPEFAKLSKVLNIYKNQQQQRMQQQIQQQQQQQFNSNQQMPQRKPQQPPPQQLSQTAGTPIQSFSNQNIGNFNNQQQPQQYPNQLQGQSPMTGGVIGQSNTTTPLVQNANLISQARSHMAPGMQPTNQFQANQMAQLGQQQQQQSAPPPPPQQQQQYPPPPQQQQQDPSMIPGGAVANNAESAFTTQQFQLLKSQFQALKYIFKTPGPPIPQNLVAFVTNETSAYPNGDYLPFGPPNKVVPPKQNIINNGLVAPPPNQIPIGGQQQQLPQQQQQQQFIGGASVTPSPNMSSGTPPVEKKKGKRGPKPKNNGQPKKLTKKQIKEEEKRLAAERQARESLELQRRMDQAQDQQQQQQVPPPQQQQPQLPPQQQSQQQLPPQQQQPPVQPPKEPKSRSPPQPVGADPSPPVNINKLLPDRSKSDKIILSVNKPNVQVDTFEIPDLVGDYVKDISLSAFYTPQSRLQFPGLLPDGINLQDINANKEVYMMLKIEQERERLMKELSNTLDEDKKKQLESELAQLELLPYQKELRGKLLIQTWFSKSLLPNSHPNFLARFNTLSLDHVIITEELYRHQLETLMQAQNQQHKNTIGEILMYSERSNNLVSRRRDRLNRLVNKVGNFHNQTAKEEQKRIERMAKQRLQALKSNDEEAYLKLLDHTKDTRITHLLKQTNQFLDTLAQAVQSQQKEAEDNLVSSGRITKPEDQIASGEPIDDEKREKIEYYNVAHRIKEEITKQPSNLVGGTLKEYQLKGLQWMVSLVNNHLNGILADEMGLGKTIQTISLLTYLIEVKKINGPFLVIVPLSTVTNWNLEFEKWAPSVKKITYKGTPNQRKVLQQDIRTGNFQILLTTYEYIIKDKTLLSRIRWIHMIIDEGHRMKNASSKLSETLSHSYHSDYRLILTGTPLQNNLPELWALLNFVLPKIFNSVKSFDEWFNTPFANTGGQDKIELSEEETLLIIRRLHKVLRPFLLRRLKKDVEKDLPNKVEKVIKCKMSSLQSKLYQQMLRLNILYASDRTDENVAVTIKNANNQIMQLRKICNHPFVYEEVENMINPTVETNDQIWRVAGKFELLDKVLPKFKRTGHKVLIFFQMTQIMDIMEDFLRYRHMKYMRLDGGTKADDRTELLKLFNAPDSDYFCFLLSTRAGGLGLNLQTADTVIIFDTDWNPHQDLQAQDRAHRIGQKNEVKILRLITEDSVEEMILERAHAKLEIDGKVIQAGKFDNKSTAEEQEAMLRALIEKDEERRQKGSDDEEDELDDDEMNEIIARNEQELVVFKKVDEERILAGKASKYKSRLFTEDELPEIYKKDPEELFKRSEEILEDYGRGARERKTATYDDHLTEEQWLRQIEGVVSDESDTEIETKPKRARGRPRGRPRSKGPDSKDDESAEPSQTESEAPSKRFLVDDSDEFIPIKRQKSGTPKMAAGVLSKGARGGARAGTVGRGRVRKLNRPTPTIDPLTPDERARLQNVIENILGLILNYKNEHERRLSDLFLVKPSRKLYPDYYVLIKHPLALDVIKKRILSKSYTQAREMLEDVHLMFSNARIYNEEGSIVFQDASFLEKLAMEKFKELNSDLSEEELNKILDFTEFDDMFNLKPLVVPSAMKHPIDAKLERLDNGEAIDSPILGISTAIETEESTPATFD